MGHRLRILRSWILMRLQDAGILQRDRYLQQARIDQRTTTYPGCVRGYQRCLMFCGAECPGSATIPSHRFVAARAERLRRGLDEPPDGGSSFTLAALESGTLPPLPDPRARQPL